MATMGQPGKYTLCFAERNDGPFPTLTARRGLGGDASAITVMGISGTAEVLPGDGEGATPEAILSPIVDGDAGGHRHVEHEPQERARRAGLPAAARRWPRRSSATTAGTSRACSATCSTRARASARAPEAIHPIVTGGAGYKMSYLPIWGGGSQTVTRAL